MPRDLGRVELDQRERLGVKGEWLTPAVDLRVAARRRPSPRRRPWPAARSRRVRRSRRWRSRPAAEASRELDRVLVGLAAESTEAEQLVDGALEVERPLAPLGVILGETTQPVGAHLHVGDLVGEHPVFAELEHRVAGKVAELLHGVEHVDRQTFERTVDAAEPQDRVGRTRGLVEEGGFRVLADLGAHPVAELHRDLARGGSRPSTAAPCRASARTEPARRRSRRWCDRRPRGPGSRR